MGHWYHYRAGYIPMKGYANKEEVKCIASLPPSSLRAKPSALSDRQMQSSPMVSYSAHISQDITLFFSCIQYGRPFRLLVPIGRLAAPIHHHQS